MKRRMPPLPRGLKLVPGMKSIPSDVHILGQTPQKKTGCVLIDPNNGEILFKWNKTSKKVWCVQDLVALTTVLAERLKGLPREGADVDEPEGARYVQFSDTLVNDIVEALENGRQPQQDGKGPAGGSSPQPGSEPQSTHPGGKREAKKAIRSSGRRKANKSHRPIGDNGKEAPEGSKGEEAAGEGIA